MVWRFLALAHQRVEDSRPSTWWRQEVRGHQGWLPASWEPVSMLAAMGSGVVCRSLMTQTSWYDRPFLLNTDLEIKTISHGSGKGAPKKS